MVLGDNNILYATNGVVLVRFDTQTGLADWVRQPPQNKSPWIMRLPEAAYYLFGRGRGRISMQRGTVLLFPSGWGVSTEETPVTLDSRSSMSSTTRLKHQSRCASCTIIRWATTSV